MRELPGIDHERLERLYLVASAKANIVAAENLLREACKDLEVAERACPASRAALRETANLREVVFNMLEHLP